MNLVRESENKFSVKEDSGRRLGTAKIARLNLERIFPDRPVQFEVTVDSEEAGKVLLYSAAVTRAMVLAAEETKPSRVYCVVQPGDATALETLRTLGLKNHDGIMQMRKPITERGVSYRLPEDYTYVNDYLNNKNEFVRCLKRYNECFGRSEKAEWLMDIRDEENFVRMMVVNSKGLCGELLAWSRGETGIVGIIQTARSCRRQGVASSLVEQARLYFLDRGMRYMTFDAWRASPGCVSLAVNAGFRDHKLMLMYPEIP